MRRKNNRNRKKSNKEFFAGMEKGKRLFVFKIYIGILIKIQRSDCLSWYDIGVMYNIIIAHCERSNERNMKENDFQKWSIDWIA